MALVAATFNESTPWDIVDFLIRSFSPSCSCVSPLSCRSSRILVPNETTFHIPLSFLHLRG